MPVLMYVCLILSQWEEADRTLKRTMSEQSLSGLSYAKDIYDAALDADALLLVTEWKEFRMPSWNVIKRSMNKPYVIDGRNIYDASELKSFGFEYEAIGLLRS